MFNIVMTAMERILYLFNLYPDAGLKGEEKLMGKKTLSNKRGLFFFWKFHSCLRKSCADSKSLSFNVSVLTP